VWLLAAFEGKAHQRFRLFNSVLALPSSPTLAMRIFGI
jgi:hypothetical protein